MTDIHPASISPVGQLIRGIEGVLERIGASAFPLAIDGTRSESEVVAGKCMFELEDSEASCPSRLELNHLITLHSPCIGASTCSWSCAFAIM
jgi:hypothetical protein